tara:strand:- start:1266 stop:2012 length:747 start_codon:yes stop_codon:yes gene_type:complete
MSTKDFMTADEFTKVLGAHQKFWEQNFDQNKTGWTFAMRQCIEIREQAKLQLKCITGKDGYSLDSIRRRYGGSYQKKPITLESIKQDYKKTLETISMCDLQLKIATQSVVVSKCGLDAMPKQMEKEMELLAELKSDFLMASMELDADGGVELTYKICTAESAKRKLEQKCQLSMYNNTKPAETGQSIRLMADKMKDQYEDGKANLHVVQIIYDNFHFHNKKEPAVVLQATEQYKYLIEKTKASLSPKW